jgi:hypothetical protein
MRKHPSLHQGLLCASTALFLALGHAAFAQTADTSRGESIFDKLQPQNTAEGMRLSDQWRLYASIEIGERYDSNIYAQRDNKVDDYITLVQPELLLATNGTGGASASLRAFGNLQYHANETSEDAKDYGVEGHALSSPQRRLQFIGDASFGHQTQDRSDPEEQADRPRTRLDRYDARGQVNFRTGQMRFGVSAEGRRLDFLQGFNDDRDRKETVLRGEVALTRSPTQEIYVSPQWTHVNYDDGLDRFGFDRDRDEWTGHVGMKIDLDGIILGTVEAGATRLKYDDPRFHDHTIATALLDIDWNITRLTTINLTAERTPLATIQSGSSVRVDSNATLSVAHELRRSLIVEAHGGLQHWDFEDIERSDNVKTAGASLSWIVNRTAKVVVQYDYFDRNSDIDLADFSRHQAMIGLTLAL